MALHRTAATLRAAVPAAFASSLRPFPFSVLNHLPRSAKGLPMSSSAARQTMRHQSSSSTAAVKGFLKGRRSPPKFRTHAVSIIHGDYEDENVDGEEAAFPPEDLEDDWALTPADALARTEAAEAATEDGDNFYPKDSETDLLLQSSALRQQREYDALRKKWAENSRPKPRVREIDDRGRAYGRGSRKEASARVWIFPGEGVVTVNRKDFVDYFPRESHRESILGPFVATRTAGMFDVRAHVEGGGMTGKAGAIRHGLARALEKYNPEYRPAMKRLGFLTRDPRMVERKKVGKVKARKSPQWVRR